MIKVKSSPTPLLFIEYFGKNTFSILWYFYLIVNIYLIIKRNQKKYKFLTLENNQSNPRFFSPTLSRPKAIRRTNQQSKLEDRLNKMKDI
jgi:hypothetical protein